MFSEYKSTLNDLKFHQSDISIIQSIYGKPHNQIRVPNRFIKHANSLNNLN